MATLAVAGVGAAIGWGVGGTAVAMSIGWSVGSALGSYLFAPDGPDIEGPRLNDLDVQSAAYGRPKPETWGTMRQAGQIIAADRIKETKHTESTGGKGGGGGGTQTTYTYSISFAIAFGEGPIDGIRRIWANGDLVWSREPNVSAGSLLGDISRVTVYTGTEMQQPDPTLEALHGAGNVPAYRGTCYVVFKDMELEDYGNSVPHIEAEIVRAGQVSDVQRLALNTGLTFSRYFGTVFFDEGLVRLTAGSQNSSTTGMSPSTTRIFTPSLQPLGQEVDYINPTNIGSPVGQLELYGDDVDRGCFYYVGHYRGLPVWRINSGMCLTAASPTNTYIGTAEAGIHATPDSEGRRLAYRTGTRDSGNGVTILGESGETIVNDFKIGSGVGSSTEIKAFAFDGEEHLWVTLAEGSDNVRLYKITGGGLVEAGDRANMPFATLKCEMAARNGVLVAATTSEFGDRGMGVFTRQALIDADAGDLPSILLDLSSRAGLEPSDIDTTGIAGTAVPGYSRTKSMTARRAIEPLQQVYRFDALESDWMLRFVPRGQEPVADIPYGDLAAHPYGQDRPEAIGETRTQEPELPREVVMRYLDVDADYEDNAQRAQRIVTGSEHKESIDVPIAESADYMAQSAEILLYTAWLERTKHRVLLPPSYEYLDPSDVITTTEADGTTHQLRISRARNGNILELEGITDSPSVYTSDATGSAIDLDPSVIGQRGPTRAALLDIPLLRDQDNDAGFYVAANGWLEGWTGSVLYVSSDGGESYGSVLPVLTGSPMGSVTNTLADGPVSVIDRASTINVQLPLGELESVTDEALMDGRRNACAVGTLDGWEILQFRDAVLESDGSYTLSHLIRGRRGTEWMTGQHTSGERFVLLTPGALERPPFSIDNIGATRRYKAVTTGKPIVGAAEIEFANHAVGLKPYAPAHLKAQAQGGGDYSVSWIRRTRIGGEWRDNVDAPLGEASELYRVRVLDGSTEVSSTETSNSSITVAASPGNTIAVAQISETVGPGYEAEITL